ncbi:Cof-type HAD-IIB family hydrolase [Microbacterium lacus]|uniref:HAD family hydrolase n=1 Tax=Microbacterium lacus TaxID=415217 RepID=UPI00384E8298
MSVSPDGLLIALDIDGTVILEDESFSPGVVDAITDTVAGGNEVMLATGRSWEGTIDILAAIGIAPQYVVCSNGAVVLKRSAEGVYERFVVETFDATEVLTLLQAHLPDAHYMVELANGSRLFTEHLDYWTLTNAEQVPFARLAEERVCRVVVVQPGKSEEEFVELVSRIGLNHVSYAVGWTAWLDIAPLGIDKGTALERVRAELGVDGGRVIVIGDGRNDVGMFAWAQAGGGRAIAMEQGPDEVRDAAGEVTASVEAGGVAAVLRAL